MPLNLLYPLKAGTYHRVRGYQDHINAGAGPWWGIDDGAVVGTQGYAPDKVKISHAQKITTGGGWNFRANLLNYPGWFVWFAHNSQIPSDGQVFERGQPMFKTGATGGVTGPHLHHSILQNGQPRNNDDPNIVIWNKEVDNEPMVNDADNEFGRWEKLAYQIRGRHLSRAEFRASAVGQTWLHAMEILSDDAEADQATISQELGQKALVDDWEGQMKKLTKIIDAQGMSIEVLQANNAVLVEQNGALQTTVDEQGNQIIDLQKQIGSGNLNPNLNNPIYKFLVNIGIFKR